MWSSTVTIDDEFTELSKNDRIDIIKSVFEENGDYDC